MARTEVTGSQIRDSSVSLTADVTGILPVVNGGTGSNTIALNNVMLGNGTGAVQTVAPGTSGNVLTSNGATWVSSELNAASVGPAYYRASYLSGQYYFTTSVASASVSPAPADTVRVIPWVVTESLTISRLWVEITGVGNAGSTFRIGIWNHDPTAAKPSTLVLDAGSVSTETGTIGVAEITVSQTLSPGIYWVGGAAQGVSTTAPQLRSVQVSAMPQQQCVTIPIGNTLSGYAPATVVYGYSLTGVSGAFGSLSSAIPIVATTSASASIKIGFKVA